jgi:hypothetical protein
MKQRCNYPKHKSYKNYGGNGIKICQSWNESFPAFLKDMGPKPNAQSTIERKNIELGYFPENCVWASKTDQTLNKSNSIFVSVKGEMMSLKQAAKVLGVKYNTAHKRYKMGKNLDGTVVLREK